MKKRVFVVAMLNSIHTAKWLKQFSDRDLEIYLFPSAYFRNLHPQIEDLVKGDSNCIYKIQGLSRFFGHLDYVKERFLSKLLSRYKRSHRLKRLLDKYSPQTVHALEFQNAGYLCLEVIEKYGKNFELITTNWGSDIYHFQEFDEHRIKISKLLQFSDKYSAECVRDVLLAKEFGFIGEILPVNPNSGGFAVSDIIKERTRPSNRNLILVKSYGGYFGRGELIINLAPKILTRFPEISFYFYSVTADLTTCLDEVKLKFPERVSYSTVSEPLLYSSLQSLFDSARIFIGCSISDGISTSFLESLVAGAYPIQTSTSCASEWVNRGAVASLVSLNPTEIFTEILKALTDDRLVDKAKQVNSKIAFKFLDSAKISNEVQVFY